MAGFDQTPAGRSARPPRRRVLVGLGDPNRERELLPAFQEPGDLAVERALTGAQLLARARDGAADVALLAADLPGLDPALLDDLRRAEVPAVILAPDPAAERWAGRALALPSEADPTQVRAALDAALRGEGPPPQQVAIPRMESAQADAPPADAGLAVIAVASGAGSPGRTTIALGLAAALGAAAPTVLVDADLAGPSLAAHLDADPTRNLYMLAHGDPRTAGDWGGALEQETQPLDPRSPHGAVLCGVPKPAMRAEVTVPLFERTVAELRARYRYVVIDVGADLLGPEAAIGRAALGLADQVLLVGSADLVGLSRLRVARDLCRARLGIDPERLAVVVNRHDRRRHHRQAEIEWALGTPLAAIVPHDHAGVQRALAAQRPVTLVGRGAAGRAILALAERAHAGRIAPPPDERRRTRWWQTGRTASRAATGHGGAVSPPVAPVGPRRRWAWPWRRESAAPLPAYAPANPAAARPASGTDGDTAVGRRTRRGKGRT